MKEIELTQGYTAIVDDEDYERLCRHNWHIVGNNAYTYIRHAPCSMQHVVLGVSDKKLIGHGNGDPKDNRKSNLRVVTRSQLGAGRQKHMAATSQYKGVSWCKQTGKWKTKITKGGQQYWLGRFDSERDAAQAYDEAAERLFGEYARLNFPYSPKPKLRHKDMPILTRRKPKRVSGSSSQYIGVTRFRDSWRAQMWRVGENGRELLLIGIFDDETQAARARDAVAARQYGQSARLNFPNR